MSGPSSETGDAADNVVEVDFSLDAEPRPLVKNGGRRLMCAHRRAAVDVKERRVWCDSCETELDPYQVLSNLGREGDRWLEAFRARKRLLKSIEDLKRRERNAKARVKKWEQRAKHTVEER